MSEKEYDHDFPKIPGLTVIPWLVWAVIIVLAIWATKAYSEPVMQTSEGGVTLQLWTDACELQKDIQNLPYKATWHENGKVIKGCWGARPDVGVVVFYFADKTVGMAPIQAFTKVVGV